jgi:hypothetical protein
LSDVAVVVVSHGTADLLSRCLESVRMYSVGLEVQTIVVDNASSDDSCRVVHKRFPEVRLVENPENVGFAIASNQGAALANAPYILLLNSDTELRPAAIRALVDFLETRPFAAAAGPRLVGTDDQPQPSASGLPNLRMQVASFLGLKRLPVVSTIVWFRRVPVLRKLVDFVTVGYFTTSLDGAAPRRVDFLSGACLLIRTEAWRAVGCLDEQIFMYLEDADWCRRARESEWELWYVPSATIYHVGGASFGAKTGGRTHHVSIERIRSVLYYFGKYEPWWKQATLRLVISLSMLARLLALVASRSRNAPDPSTVRSIIHETLTRPVGRRKQ